MTLYVEDCYNMHWEHYILDSWIIKNAKFMADSTVTKATNMSVRLVGETSVLY